MVGRFAFFLMSASLSLKFYRWYIFFSHKGCPLAHYHSDSSQLSSSSGGVFINVTEWRGVGGWSGYVCSRYKNPRIEGWKVCRLRAEVINKYGRSSLEMNLAILNFFFPPFVFFLCFYVSFLANNGRGAVVIARLARPIMNSLLTRHTPYSFMTLYIYV